MSGNFRADGVCFERLVVEAESSLEGFTDLTADGRGEKAGDSKN